MSEKEFKRDEGLEQTPAQETKGIDDRSPLPLYLILILCAVISISASAATLWWYHANIAPKVISFDLKKFTADLRIQNTDGALTEEQMLARFDEMGQWLDDLPPNHVVLLKELVLQNGEPAPY